MRTIFLGTADIARPVLRALVEGGHEVLAIVTQPDRPRGRSGAPQPPPVKEEARALSLGCPLLQPERLGRQTREKLAALAPEVGIVVAYGQILSRELLALPRHGFLNVHASLLPRWRGAAPVQRAIAAGDAETGVTIMRVVPRLDAGPMLALARTPIGPADTSDVVLARLGELGAKALLGALADLALGRAQETPQDEAATTYAEPIRKEEGRIDFSLPARAIDARLRAFTPWPGAFAFVERAGVPAPKGGPLRLEVLATEAARRPEGAPADGPPGTVLEASGDRLVVACGDGAIRLLRVKPAGKRDMAAAEWLRGRAVTVGDRLA